MPLSYRTRARLWSLVDSLAKAALIAVTVFGMSGVYALEDPETGRKERVHWSVSNPLYRSQEEARDEAVRRLETSAPAGVRPTGAETATATLNLRSST